MGKKQNLPIRFGSLEKAKLISLFENEPKM